MAKRGSRSIEIEASCKRVFEVLHNYDVRLDWDSMLSSADLLDGADSAGQDVLTRCVGNWKCFWLPVEARYVSYNAGEVAAVKMTNRPWFFEQFAATIRHESLGESKSRTTYIYSFESKPRWLAFLFEPIMNAALNREVKHRLNALKTFIEHS